MITLTDVMRYFDNMDEDQWQEFCGCLECRGWYFNSLKWVPVSIQMPLPRTDVWVSSDLGQMSAWYDDHCKVWRASHNHDLELIVRAWHDLPDDYEGEAV